jgi:dienelactone hydrolase
MKKLACLSLLLAASGCPSVDVDDFGEETRPAPVVEFDPSTRIVPFPNNLLLDPTTGKVNLPAQCNESPTTKALRENVLNQLDGFGLFETALTVTFSEAIDVASLADRIVVYKRVTGTTPVEPAMAAPLPIVTQLSSTPRFDADCKNPSLIPQIVIIPRVPLEQKSTYVVALLDGIKTEGGTNFQPSGTWRLIRGAENPVTVQDGTIVSDRTPLDPADDEDRARLLGIDLLWKAHAGAVKFLAADLPADKRKPRDQILLAWEFRTQTSTDPLDPMVAGSPASEVATTPLVMNTSLPTTINRTAPPYNQCAGTDSDTQCYLKIQIGRGNYAVGDATCQSLGCAAIADVVGSGLLAKQYQIDTPNPYTGTGTRPIPGPWNNPVDPTEVKDEAISVLSFVPASAMPTGGYPVVVFQHALGQSKTTAFAIAGRLAAAGFATIAIDAVGHDSRAVRVSSNTAINCADAGTPPMCSRPDCGPSPVDFPQCYAPFLSPNLSATRDGIRQTVIDNLRLIAALKACSTTACGTLKVDPAKVLYLGQSLGGIVGSITAAVSPDLKATVLNVPGVGWVDILENTGTLRLQCPLVDGLIDAGILMGEKSNLAVMPPTGLCTTEAWKMQIGYRQFSAIGRWVLDPADPANFTRKLAPRRLLLQEVVGDTVVPNLATGNEGMLLGLMPAVADPAAAVPPAPSGAITTNPTASKWVRYPTLPADGGTGFPGNTFHHGSLLSPTPTPMPPPPPVDGALGTLRMQVDALTFLSANQ